MWSWDLAESHQHLTRCVWMILHLSRSLWKECVGLQCVDRAAWRAVHVPSITTHCPARAGTVQGTNLPLLTRSAGTVMGASGWSNDLGENFLWKVLFSLCCGLQARKRLDISPPPPHILPPGALLQTSEVWTEGIFLVIVPSEQKPHQIFLNISQQKWV